MSDFVNAVRKIRFSTFQLAKITTLLLRNRSLVDYSLIPRLGFGTGHLSEGSVLPHSDLEVLAM